MGRKSHSRSLRPLCRRKRFNHGWTRMNTDAEKALTRITLIAANDYGPRVCDPQKLHVPRRLVYSATHRSFTLLRVADPRSGRAQFAKIRAIRVQLSDFYPCSSMVFNSDLSFFFPSFLSSSLIRRSSSGRCWIAIIWRLDWAAGRAGVPSQV